MRGETGLSVAGSRPAGSITPASPPASAALRVEHHCTQCGAPALLEDTDRLFQCGFCRVKLCLLPGDGFRYLVPPRIVGGEILYFPYWRLRGTHYRLASPGTVEHRYVDTSLPALDVAGFPRSLGIRPQAMTLRFVTLEAQGTFIRPGLSARDASVLAAERYAEGAATHEFIGETTSLVYAPFCVRKRLVDAVLNTAVSGELPSGFQTSLRAETRVPDEVQLVAALCPACGWDLEGEREALALTCRGCAVAWYVGARSLERLDVAVLDDNVDASLYLPFWRFESKPRNFWTPAFKIRPGIYLRLGSTLTVTDPGRYLERNTLSTPRYPVTMPMDEARDSIRWIVVTMRGMPGFDTPNPDIPATLPRPSLVYVPFCSGTMELENPVHEIVLERNALSMGRTL